MKNNEIIFNDLSTKIRYLKDLGKGGGGSAALAYDESINKECVIKKLEPDKGNENLFNYDKFKKEASILFMLEHHNIVRIYNFYEYPDKNLYINMEYVEGKPIRECVSDKSLDWNKIFEDGISAFCQLEEKGILHRDIRSNNILIDKNGNIKIIDFGFSKEVCNGNDGTNQNTACLNWEAPKPHEIRTKNKYNHATDIYYLGYLFKDIIDEIDNFKYRNIIEKMIKDNEEGRYKSFFEIQNDIITNADIEQLFCEYDILVYKNLINKIYKILSEYHI